MKDDYTSNNFGQSENRDGYSAQGEYFVNLPDGRLQKVKFQNFKFQTSKQIIISHPKVTYTVSGDGGYVADVQYTGEAQYPPEPAGGYGKNKV